MNFAHYFNNRFAGCRLLAEAYDNCRNRDVKIYQVPGQLDCVGISDGVDRWVAPVAPEIFSVDIQKLLRDLNAGLNIKLPVIAGKAQPKGGRRRLLDDGQASPPKQEPEPVRRRAILSETSAPARRKLIV